MKFAFISKEKVAFSVAAICRLLAVSPSGYFAAQKRPRSSHARRDQELSEQVAAAHLGSKRRYPITAPSGTHVPVIGDNYFCRRK